MKKTLSVFSFINTYPDLWDSALPLNPVCCSGKRRKLISHNRNLESGSVGKHLTSQLLVYLDQWSSLGGGGGGRGGGNAQSLEVRLSINKRENT